MSGSLLVVRIFSRHPIFIPTELKSIERHQQEAADLHPFAGRDERLDAFGGDPDDLAGAEEAVDFVVQVRQGAGLHRGGKRTGLARQHDGRAAIAGGVDALAGKQQDRARAVDQALGGGDPLFEAAVLIDQRRDQLRRVDLPAAHLGEVGLPLRRPGR